MFATKQRNFSLIFVWFYISTIGQTEVYNKCMTSGWSIMFMKRGEKPLLWHDEPITSPWHQSGRSLSANWWQDRSQWTNHHVEDHEQAHTPLRQLHLQKWSGEKKNKWRFKCIRYLYHLYHKWLKQFPGIEFSSCI